MAGNGGPWGGGGSSGGSGGQKGSGGSENNGGGRRPDDSQIPEIDELMKKGQEQLRVLMGGKSDRNGSGGNGGGRSPQPSSPLPVFLIAGLVAVGAWLFNSVYTNQPNERSVELFLGKRHQVGQPGLNFAFWPLVTYEKVDATSERTEDIGASDSSADGLMLTTDENIVNIGFQVVWTVNDPEQYVFNIAEPKETVQAVSESVMREIIAARNLSPILNRDRGVIADEAMLSIQATLDEYQSGIQVERINLEKADPPEEVIDSFREVQAAEQERDRLERAADAYSNRVVAEARGAAAQIRENSEAYRAEVVNQAIGEASRFGAVLEEYSKAPDVTRRRLYLETMEKVMSGVDKTILDPSLTGEGGSNVVPYLPLDQLNRSRTTDEGN